MNGCWVGYDLKSVHPTSLTMPDSEALCAQPLPGKTGGLASPKTTAHPRRAGGVLGFVTTCSLAPYFTRVYSLKHTGNTRLCNNC